MLSNWIVHLINYPKLKCNLNKNETLNIYRCFENFKHVFKHVLDTHLKTDVEGYCRWEGCEKLQRKKWSLVTHVQVIVGVFSPKTVLFCWSTFTLLQ